MIGNHAVISGGVLIGAECQIKASVECRMPVVSIQLLEHLPVVIG